MNNLIDYTILKTEIGNTQYFGLSDLEISNILNTSISGQTSTVAMAAKTDVLMLAQEVVFGALSATGEVQQKWLTVLPILSTLLTASTDTISLSSVYTSIMAAVSDNLITQDEANAPWIKLNSSRGEVLFGANVIITEQDIGEARNGT